MKLINPAVFISVAAMLLVGCKPPQSAQNPQPATAPAPTQPPVSRPSSQPAATIPTSQQIPPVTGEAEKAHLSDVVQLTTGFDKAGEGYFSAKMDWIIFQASPKGEPNYQMYIAPLSLDAGKPPHIGHPIRISPDKSRNTCGFFAPDGQSLIFGSTAGKEDPKEASAGFQRQGGNYRWAFPNGMEIYRAKDWQAEVTKAGFLGILKTQEVTPAVLVAPTTQPVRPPPTPGDIDLAKPENRITENDAYDAEGSFSPDSKWICFSSRRTGDSEIWVMKADGTSPVQITHAKGYDGGPYFAPDGKRLIYRSDRKGNDLLQIFIADLAFDEKGDITGMTEEHQLTNDENVNWCPYFHPDNKHLIFATSRHGHDNYELYAMRDDGSHLTRITYTPGFDGLPVFSPDGNYLMWSAKRAKDNTTQLFIGKFTPPKDW